MTLPAGPYESATARKKMKQGYKIVLLALQRYGTGKLDTRCCILITICLLHGVALTQSDNVGIVVSTLTMHLLKELITKDAFPDFILNTLTDGIRQLI